MAERGALGEAGRAGRVLDVDRLGVGEARLDLREVIRSDALGAGEQVAPAVRAEEDDLLQARHVAANLLDHRRVVAGPERRGGDDHPDPGLAEDVLQLVGPVGRVDVDEDRAHLGRGELDDDPLRAVGGPDPDPVALLDAGGDEPSGRHVHVPLQLGPGPSGPLLDVDQRLPVREPRDRVVEVVADRLLDEGDVGLADGVGQSGFGGHRRPPWSIRTRQRAGTPSMPLRRRSHACPTWQRSVGVRCVARLHGRAHLGALLRQSPFSRRRPWPDSRCSRPRHRRRSRSPPPTRTGRRSR